MNNEARLKLRSDILLLKSEILGLKGQLKTKESALDKLKQEYRSAAPNMNHAIRTIVNEAGSIPVKVLQQKLREGHPGFGCSELNSRIHLMVSSNVLNKDEAGNITLGRTLKPQGDSGRDGSITKGILSILREHPGSSVKEVAEKLGSNSANVGAMLVHLRKKELAMSQGMPVKWYLVEGNEACLE